MKYICTINIYLYLRVLSHDRLIYLLLGQIGHCSLNYKAYIVDTNVHVASGKFEDINK